MNKNLSGRSRRVCWIIAFFLLGAILAMAWNAPLTEGAIQKIKAEAPVALDAVTRVIKFESNPGEVVQGKNLVEVTDLPEVEPQIKLQGAGPLRVSPDNPRYFSNGNGQIVYLTGSHTWSNLQDNGKGYPPPVFNYTAYLDFLQSNHHNFFRLWTWEQSRWTLETTDEAYWFDPMPYQRTGPGNALDGKPRFDLTKFNEAYFSRMYSRIAEASKRGIYVSIMLFDGWSVQYPKLQYGKNNPWKGHPFNESNNINGINGDKNRDSSGDEVHTLGNSAVTEIQKAYIRKVIDTVNDLDNVLYEISNESDGGATEWQYELISYIKAYEKTKPKQHPVGMTVEYFGGTNDELFKSQADWISPNGGDYPDVFSPTPATGAKVMIIDTDHLCGVCGDRQFVWKSFTRGYNPIFMDIYDGAGYGVGAEGFDPADSTLKNTRFNMGRTLSYASRLNLKMVTPQPALASTGYCLANPKPPAAEYLIYAPNGGSFSVDLSGSSGSISGEWFDPQTGMVTRGIVTTGGGTRSFKPPFNGDAVLYLYQGKTETSNFLPSVLMQEY